MKNILLTTLLLVSFSLSAQSWDTLGLAPVGRHHPISFAIDGKGYAVTGTSSSGFPTKDAYEYDPANDTWTKINDFPDEARSFGIGTVVNGKAYLGFGSSNIAYFNDLWSFEPATQTWEELASCSCSARQHPAMIATDEKIYVGLGNNALGNLKDWAVYDIASNTWTDIADFPGPERHHPFMFNAGGEIYAGLGHGDGPGINIYKDWYKLNQTTNTWTAMNDFPGEGRVAGTQFNIGPYGYVLSGDGDNHNFMPTGEMWRYDPSDDTWLEYPSHPGISIWAPGSFVIENDIYFYGGQNNVTNAYPTSVYKYTDTIDLTVVETPNSILNPDQILSNTYVYPNPANDFIALELDESVTQVKIYNTIGQLILTNNTEIKKIDTKEFNDGLYVIQFFNESTTLKTSKFLIKH